MNRDQESVAVPGRYIDCSYVQSVMKNVHGVKQVAKSCNFSQKFVYIIIMLHNLMDAY